MESGSPSTGPISTPVQSTAGVYNAPVTADEDKLEALRRATLAAERLERELNATRARLGVLTDILQAQGILQAGHLKLMDSEARDATTVGPRPKVQLKVIQETTIDSAVIDCASRLHLCQARCCTLQVTLSEDDLANGLVWEIHEPYLMRREVDGYCTYLDRGTAGCTSYALRPWECRVYDCRQDPRIWVDFDKGIAAEPPSTLRPLVLKPR
jgi:Fe-S-cluster containining protein